LNEGNSFALSEPVSRMGAVRNETQKPFKKDDKRAAIELWKAQVPLSCIRGQLKMFREDLEEDLGLCHRDGGEDRAVRLPPEAGRLHAQEDAGGH
jgi:hypothetical protein